MPCVLVRSGRVAYETLRSEPRRRQVHLERTRSQPRKAWLQTFGCRPQFNDRVCPEDRRSLLLDHRWFPVVTRAGPATVPSRSAVRANEIRIETLACRQIRCDYKGFRLKQCLTHHRDRPCLRGGGTPRIRPSMHYRRSRMSSALRDSAWATTCSPRAHSTSAAVRQTFI